MPAASPSATHTHTDSREKNQKTNLANSHMNLPSGFSHLHTVALLLRYFFKLQNIKFKLVSHVSLTGMSVTTHRVFTEAWKLVMRFAFM